MNLVIGDGEDSEGVKPYGELVLLLHWPWLDFVAL